MFGIIKEKQILIEIPKNNCLSDKIDNISSLLLKTGEWKTKHNWDNYACTNFKITKVNSNGSNLFKVDVKCGYELSCMCPTIERAVQIACLYQNYIESSFKQLGWPTWVSKTQPE